MADDVNTRSTSEAERLLGFIKEKAIELAAGPSVMHLSPLHPDRQAAAIKLEAANLLFAVCDEWDTYLTNAPAPQDDGLVEELALLLRTETSTNALGVEIVSHPELGAIEWQERCADFVANHGKAILAALNPGAIIACAEAWKADAAIIGCTVQGFDDGRHANFFTPDGNVIAVGPQFRAAIRALKDQQP